jgi:MFS family permease
VTNAGLPESAPGGAYTKTNTEGSKAMHVAEEFVLERRGAETSTAAERRKVVFASSLGTVFEWYDFYLYGSLALFFSALFFPPGNDTIAFLASLATFGAGFGVRPFGAIVFGYLGDIIGRKYTFLITIVLMGGATAAVGLLPTYEQIGIWATILLVTLRLLQGLALGGEYGGAATYVAEHAAEGRRGFLTSWIQTTATLGFFLSLAVIAACRVTMDDASFREWGWRVPFLVSVLLLAVSVYIRTKLHESPVFKEMKAQGKGSKNPIWDSFAHWYNAKYVLLALFGAVAGQGVVWYTGQFYALFFMQNTLRVDYMTAYLLIAVALALGTPMFVFFGWLSDRIGRKPIMLAGCLLAAITYFPIFQALTSAVNPALASANVANPVTVSGDPGQCETVVFADPVTACQKVMAQLSKGGVQYAFTATPAQPLVVTVGTAATLTIPEFVKETVVKDEAGKDKKTGTAADVNAALAAAKYPKTADVNAINYPLTLLLLTLLMVYVAMVYGPIAAFLVELFPTKIRYTSMSLPYHIGNGWFGGFLPFISLAIVTATGDMYAGLWYPVGIAVMTLVIGFFFLPETKDRRLDAEDDRLRPL